MLAAGFRTALFVLNRVCDGVFAADIVAQFNISFLDPATRRLTRSRRAVALRYLRGVAVVDVVSTIPFDLISWGICGGDCAGRGSSTLRALVVLRVLKMLRLSRLSRVLTHLHEHGNVRSGYVALLKYLCTMLILIHWLACGLHAVAQFEGAACNWVLHAFAGGCEVPASALLPEELPNVGSVYLASLLWSTQTALTVGYGDITAVTDAERAYVIAAMLVSGIFYSFIIGAFVGAFPCYGYCGCCVHALDACAIHSASRRGGAAAECARGGARGGAGWSERLHRGGAAPARAGGPPARLFLAAGALAVGAVGVARAAGPPVAGAAR